MSNFIPPKRKVVQIALSSEGETCMPCLFALCDDGHLFYQVWAADASSWQPAPLPPGCEP
jgi:hypothetical protein